MVRIKLSPAQVSALECRGLDQPFGDDEAALADAWNGNQLVFEQRDADLIADALTEASNAEDAFAEEMGHRDPEGAKYARSAARSLATLAGKVRKESATSNPLTKKDQELIERARVALAKWDRLREALEKTIHGHGGIYESYDPAEYPEEYERADRLEAYLYDSRELLLHDSKTATGRLTKQAREAIQAGLKQLGEVEYYLVDVWEVLPRENPPYSGYRPDWTKRKLPKDLYRACYKTKSDALNVFLTHNHQVVEDYGGPDMVHSPESFEAINHRFGLQGKRRVNNIAKAVWWALPGPGPWCLEDINIDLLNQTAPVLYNQSGYEFRLPDHLEEQRLIEDEREWYQASFPEHEEVPF